MREVFKKMLMMILAITLVIGIVPMKNVEAATPKINKKKITLYVGKGFTLKIKNNKKKVKWSSSDKRVASVSSKGKVKAKKVGKTTVTGKVGNKKYKCKVTVKKEDTAKKEDTPKKEDTTKKIDMTTRVSAPIVDNDRSSYYIANFGFIKDSFGGIDFHWRATNNSGKTINYYYVTLEFINAVGDPAYDTITGLSTKTVGYVGPVAPGEDLLVSSTVGYVPVCDTIKITNIKLKYSDGTEEEGPYGDFVAKKYYK